MDSFYNILACAQFIINYFTFLVCFCEYQKHASSTLRLSYNYKRYSSELYRNKEL